MLINCKADGIGSYILVLKHRSRELLLIPTLLVLELIGHLAKFRQLVECSFTD